MADPRATLYYDALYARFMSFDIDDSTITFAAASAGGSAEVGLAVTLSDDHTIALVADAGRVLGKLTLVESDGKATVQVGGVCTLPGGTSATLTHNNSIVGDLSTAAEGYIRDVDTAAAAELGVMRGLIIDASTTTAVIVDLDVG